jgi:hypothetical protein
MPNTIHGLPYPASTDAPNVPVDLQKLAEALDAYVPVTIRKTAAQSVTNSAALVDDTHLFVDLTPGYYIVDAWLSAGGPAAADIKTAWSFAGTIGGDNHRHCHGPQISTADVTATLARMSVHSLATSVPYGTDGTATSAIHERLYVPVTAAGRLRLRWAQNTANVTASTLAAGWTSMLVTKAYGT